MSKVKAGRLRALAKEYEIEKLSTDGSVLRCNLCDVAISVDSNHQTDRIVAHIKSARHISCKSSAASLCSKKQSFVGEAFETAEVKTADRKEFCSELAEAFIQADIPLDKLQNPILRRFLQKYTGRDIPDESTLRKSYVQPIFDKTLEEVKKRVGDCPVCFILDETTDCRGRYVLNILVAPLSGRPEKPMLFKMYLLEKTNNTTVMQSFNDACSKLWPSGNQYNKVRLVVTDQAPYMLLAFDNLKPLYPNLKHVTCLAHALHRVGEAIRDEYTIANDFISQMKKILLKAPERVRLYKETTGNCLICAY